MRYKYTENIGDIYVTHEFEDLTLSDWLIVHKELNPNEGVPVTEEPVSSGNSKEIGRKTYLFHPLFKMETFDTRPLTKKDLERGGWFLKDTSLEAKKAFECVGLAVYPKEWGVGYYASDFNINTVFPNKHGCYLEPESTREIVLDDGKFYYKR